ncbi:MAG: zinc-ribbon domain-containing protein, partial [Chloroflexi bacterium]|nr:zinc-ribbon domain-containing protein [Chloroflexota bacterium]
MPPGLTRDRCEFYHKLIRERLQAGERRMQFCPKCGNQVPDGSRFCRHCGAGLTGAQQTPPTSARPPVSQPSQGSGTAPANTLTLVLLQAAIVFVVCAVIPLLLGSALGWPAREIKDALPDWNCSGEVPGSAGMDLCSMKVGALAMAGPLIL